MQTKLWPSSTYQASHNPTKLHRHYDQEIDPNATRSPRVAGLSGHDNGFSETLVHEVLTGRRPCKRGQSHNIAVALGMKAGIPTTRPARVSPAQRRMRPVAAIAEAAA